ncbi:MAG: carbohydrate kinase, partial [Spirochaetales bacterium]|nr:carbohydrate kinase [Spirochaetales bacterium]
RSGARVLVVTKAATEDDGSLDPIRGAGVEVVVLDSPQSTSILNVYESEDRERRTVTLLSQALPFDIDEIPQTVPRIYHLAGLFKGEIPTDFIDQLSKRAKVGLDAQGVLRCNEDGRLLFRDWEDKLSYLKNIAYLKTDAAEAEILTGESDRIRAARILFEQGAGEVMVTHNTEVLVFDGSAVHRAPFTPRNLSGRTGRGDTCFAAYLARRLNHEPGDAVRFAAALTSIKMESPGPFSGNEADVLARVKVDMGR